MELLKSRFYNPERLIVINNEDKVEVADSSKLYSSNTPFRDLLNDSLSSIYLFDEDLVIHNDKLKNFEKCTDFSTISYSPKSDLLYEDEECFFNPELEVFILTNKNLSNEYDNQIFDEGLQKVGYVFYQNTNPKSKENLQILFSNYLEKYISKESKVSILLKTPHGIETKVHKVKPYRIDFQTMYNDDFIEVHNRVKKTITTGHKGVVLFYGIAGSGKTNYIKWLTSQIPNKKFIFVPTTMISSLTDPNFISILIDNKNSVLILEDCENYIAERSSLNINTDVVSSILNIADGILSDIVQCQLICTFNSDISKIDTALLRKGRLIAEYKFRELTVEKSNKYLESVGKDIKVDKPYSLAELTNIDIIDIKEKKKDSKLGFR